MRIFYRDKMIEINDRKITREKILNKFKLNPITVILVNKKTNTLIPVTESLEKYEEIELRSVVSGG